MKKILIIQTASLGDVILATSVVETLHHFYPEFSIDILIRKSYEDVFQFHPFINKVVILDRKVSKLKEIFRLVKEIRSTHYFAVINIQRFFTSGLFTAFSNSPIRSGFQKNPWSFTFTQISKHELTGIHEINRNGLLLSIFKINEIKPPCLYPSNESFLKVQEYKNNPYICIAPASLWFTKQFPKSKWIEFLKIIPENLFVYFIGSNEDIFLVNDIIHSVKDKKCVNLCGQLSILETAALMKDAIMNFMNDSAPLHIASAIKAPATAIFCSTITEFGFGPINENDCIVQTDEGLSCRPCGIHGRPSCPKKHFLCALSIDVIKLKKRILF